MYLRKRLMGVGKGLCFSEPFLYWNVTDTKTFQTRASYPFATFAHFSLPSIHLLQRKCSWFLLPSGFCGYCKINLLDKTLEASTRVGSSIRSTQTTLEKKKKVFWLLIQTPGAVFVWLWPLPILCRHCDGLSKHTHAQIHTQSAAAQDPDCPDIYTNPGGGKADWNVLGKKVLDH